MENCDSVLDHALGASIPLLAVSSPCKTLLLLVSTPFASSSLSAHAVCSKHGLTGSWCMAEFCEECDQIAAVAAANYQGPFNEVLDLLSGRLFKAFRMSGIVRKVAVNSFSLRGGRPPLPR